MFQDRPCPYFGECGGCSLQNIEYPQQLKMKEERLRQYLRYFQVLDDIEKIEPIKEADSIWYYRNKMEFSFYHKDKLILGLHRKGSPQVIDIDNCLIFSQKGCLLARKVYNFFKERNFPAYNVFNHKGILRHLVVKEAKFTGEILINLVTTSQGEIPGKELIEYLEHDLVGENVKSFIWTINDSLSDAVVVDKEILLWGRDYIIEEMDSLKFKIQSQSFFQTNPVGVRYIYRRIKSLVKEADPKLILDLYSGIGAISLYLADIGGDIKGVELVKSAVQDAYGNLRLNNIRNVEFMNADVNRFLYENKETYRNLDCLIVNPPRQGLPKRVLKKIVSIEPKNIFYLSCNPYTLAQNLSFLRDYPYKIKFIQPVDLFPHTPHFEVLCFISRDEA